MRTNDDGRGKDAHDIHRLHDAGPLVPPFLPTTSLSAQAKPRSAQLASTHMLYARVTYLSITRGGGGSLVLLTFAGGHDGIGGRDELGGVGSGHGEMRRRRAESVCGGWTGE